MNTKVDPGSVVVIVEPGRVKVLRIRLVIVLAGKVDVMVDVTPGRVIVESTVDPGNCVVIVCVTAGKTIIEVTVEAGNCDVMVCVTAGLVIVVKIVLAGSWVV